MTKLWIVIVLLAVCCLGAPTETKAQHVFADTGVAYYEPTNELLAYSEAWSDYPADLYYCLEIGGPVYKDGVEAAWISGTNYPASGEGYCGGWANADTWLPYDANAEYEVLSSYNLVTSYRVFDESGMWADYYNFAQYGYADPNVFAPISYDFSGPGPSVPNIQNIFLGSLYSLFQMGAMAGGPHHLKVVSDQILQGPCGQAQRFITFRVVDQQGRGAGGTYLKEIFPGTITDTCSNFTVTPSPCSLNYTGPTGSNFTDVIRTGCPTIGGACGFTINPNKWAKCTFGIPVQTLATMNYMARWAFVSIDSNSSPWPAGKEFFP